MFEVSEIIYQILSSDIEVADVCSDRIYPLIADQNDILPFIVYSVEELPVYSKNKKNAYVITVNAFAETFNDVADLNSKIKAAFLNASEIFKYNGSSPNYNDEGLFSLTQKYSYNNN